MRPGFHVSKSCCAKIVSASVVATAKILAGFHGFTPAEIRHATKNANALNFLQSEDQELRTWKERAVEC